MRDALTPSPSPERRHDYGMRDTLSPSPEPIIGMQETPPSPLGGPSIARSEFHITRSYIHLTLIHAAWKWGERAPPPRGETPKGQSSMSGETDLEEFGGVRESVC